MTAARPGPFSSRYTREIHTHGAASSGLDTRRNGRKSRQRRYELQRVAQSIMYKDGIEPKKQHRVVWCHRHVVTEGAIPVHRKYDGAWARLGKVKTCGSVWACPVCAAKIAETRRRERVYATVKHTAAGGYAYLVTFIKIKVLR